VDELTIKIDTTEVEKALTALPSRFARKAARSGLRAAGEVMLAPMKALCPERTDEPTPDSNSLAPGVLRESLTTQVQFKKRYPPRVKVGAPVETRHVAWWIENGFDNVKAKRHVEGKHFMSAAFDESAEKAVAVLLEDLSTTLEINDTGTEDEEGE
jgi:hypothetical protein